MKAIFVYEGKSIDYVPAADVAAGDVVVIGDIVGVAQFDIPEGTQSGTSFTVKGRGIPNISGRGRGNIVFRVIVEVPKSLTAEQKDALRKFSDLCGNSNYSKRSSFFDKFRKDNRK